MQKRRVIGTIPINVTTEFEKAPLPDLCRTILANKSGGRRSCYGRSKM